MITIPLLAGALATLLFYVAAILCASGVRLERCDRRWRLLHERQPLYLDPLSDVSLDPLLLPHH